MLFTDLHLNPEIIRAIDSCNFQTPTKIQQKIIPLVLQGHDVVASSQTGTGKTAAYVLPILNRLTDNRFMPAKKVKVLVLSPTRELAQQIFNSWKTFGKHLRYEIATLVGGVSYDKQIKSLRRGADIVVATPGRLLDHLKSKRIDLSNVSTFVLDEADRMLDMGFRDDVLNIANYVCKKRQTMLFSATIDKQLQHIINTLTRKPTVINLSGDKIIAPKIAQELVRIKNQKDKADGLKKILQDKCIYKAVIFTATKYNAKNLAEALCHQGYQAAALHGDLKQSARERTLASLKKGKIQLLVATDVLARGIDVQDISHVINYDLPHNVEDYVHRIGRTARAEKSGIAISFILPGDERKIAQIEKYIGEQLDIKHGGKNSNFKTKASNKTNQNKHAAASRRRKKASLQRQTNFLPKNERIARKAM